MSVDETNLEENKNFIDEENDPVYLKNVIADLKKSHLGEINELRVIIFCIEK